MRAQITGKIKLFAGLILIMIIKKKPAQITAIHYCFVFLLMLCRPHFLIRILSGFLLVILLFNSVGYIGAYYYARAKIKKEIKMKLKGEFPKGQLKLITISTAKGEDKLLNWKAENEFLYQGRMYDIISLDEKEEGIIHYLCIDDEDETKLFAQMDQLIQREFQGNSNKRSSALKIFDKTQQDYLAAADLSALINEEQCEFPLRDFTRPYNLPHDPITPPPRII